LNQIDVEIQDLPEQFQQIAEVIGFHSTKKLMVEMAGTTIKFPVHYPPAIIKRFIHTNYNGKNVMELAARLGMTRQTIFKYLNSKFKVVSV